MRISIVVPAFNEEKLLAESLRSIRSAMETFSRAGWDAELIVCDNNSTDRTAELARAAGALVVFEPVNQISRARNTGAAAASGDWLLFIDADSHPTAGLFADVIAAINTRKYVAGGSTVRLDSSSRVTRGGTRLWNCISRVGKYLAGSFIFCETAAFRELGGFSTRLFASEEIELSNRLGRFARQRGKKLVILHHHPLLTSARKVELYTLGELFHFLARTILGGGATLRSRDACHPWYDGRR